MSLKLLKQYKNTDNFTLWADADSGFEVEIFLAAIQPLGVKVVSLEIISIAPAETCHTIITKQGVIYLSRTFDEFPGVTLFSKSATTMAALAACLEQSGEFAITDPQS
uniref:hypothetical protein n=1 Tax=Thaumasiovibrio occultus TaxID=1891184 RepID=UPI000B353CDE|nr:hypothetical protein [Thaumasiovibrio occultus]